LKIIIEGSFTELGAVEVYVIHKMQMDDIYFHSATSLAEKIPRFV